MLQSPAAQEFLRQWVSRGFGPIQHSFSVVFLDNKAGERLIAERFSTGREELIENGFTAAPFLESRFPAFGLGHGAAQRIAIRDPLRLRNLQQQSRRTGVAFPDQRQAPFYQPRAHTPGMLKQALIDGPQVCGHQ
jgi:hypothetical protein